ncbi:DUF6470 family protein [Robertmurraya sp. FSL W8-0741]|uniref:DUF6470 family protein n=1 Tax=Robertmurraya TaxID=2837507 RepID=UPI0010F76F1B|nr:DUF6470 family protein [Robertmurraya siralis]
MKLPRLEIDSQLAYLGLNKSRSTIEIRQPKADMSLNQPQPEVEYMKTDSKLEIDQTEAFADANLKNPLRVVKEWAAKAKQKALQSIAENAVEGNRLMRIEGQRKSAIPEIARENSEPDQMQFNIGYMPSSADKVKFSYQPSTIEIKVHRGNFNIDIKPNEPIIKYNPGNLQIYLKQKASMQIRAVGAALDQKI